MLPSCSIMNPDLTNLIELQKLDTTIRALEAEIKSLPRKIGEIESTLAEHIQAVEADKHRVAENQRGRRKREGDIAASREKISKLKGQMVEVKTNEQYRAFLHEIDFHEAAIRKLEDEILTEMIESENLEKQLRQTEQSLTQERSRAQGEIHAAQQRKQEDEEKLNAAREQRGQAKGALPIDIYEGYERILVARKGLAVAEVHNGACGACHVRLRPQAFNDVRTNEAIPFCESCGCILYYITPRPDPPAQTDL